MNETEKTFRILNYLLLAGIAVYAFLVASGEAAKDRGFLAEIDAIYLFFELIIHVIVLILCKKWHKQNEKSNSFMVTFFVMGFLYFFVVNMILGNHHGRFPFG